MNAGIVTLDEFVAEVLERLRADMSAIRNPGGDVHPALFHYFEGESIRRMKIPKRWFDDDRSKDAMTRAIAAANTTMRPHLFAFEVTTYMLSLSPEEVRRPRVDKDGQPTKWIKDVPGSYETLSVIAFSRAEIRFADARITRDGRNPPVYGEWEIFTPDEMQGAIYEPLQRSMRG